MHWDIETDLVIVGSGAAGLSAAIRCHTLGNRCIVLEGSDRFGGSTAISGGVVWIPANPQMAAHGIADSRDDAIAYLTHLTVGQVEPAHIETYVDHSVRMLAFLHAHTHLSLRSLAHYSDYYPHAPGGRTGGRSMEPVPFDAARLGDLFLRLRRPHRQSQVLGKFGITAREAHLFVVSTWRTRVQLAWRLIQYGLRWFKRRRYHRDTRLHAGNALVASLLRTLQDLDATLWSESPARRLIVEEGRVVGVEAEHEGRHVTIRGRQGVLLAAGGFERSQDMRDRHHHHLSSTDWNAGNPHNLGEGIQMGAEVGGALRGMHEAWWTPVTRVPRADKAWVLVVEKSLPGSILVNEQAQRFCNEAAPYQDVVHAMVAHDAVPNCFLIFDARYRRDYPVGPVAPGYAIPDSRLSRKYRDGFLIRADSLAALAVKCDLDPEALEGTVARFNPMADAGRDEDFERGESATDRTYSDGRVRPNPCLRAIAAPPFYAIRVYPGDLGTKGGLVTDVRGRVLDASDQPIAGLYAAGNTAASVMGPTYPGAGGTIGPALTFGFLAAEAAAADTDAVASRTAAAGGA